MSRLEILVIAGVIIFVIWLQFLIVDQKEQKATILCELEGGLHYYDGWDGIGYCNNGRRVGT